MKILTDIMAVVSSSQYFKMREMKIESRVSVMAFPMLSAIWNLVGDKQDSSAKSICFPYVVPEKDRSQGRQQKSISKLSGWGRETPPRTVWLVVGVGFATALFRVRGDTDEKAIVAARHGA